MEKKSTYVPLAKRDRAKQDYLDTKGVPRGDFFTDKNVRDQFLIEQTKASVLSDLHSLRDTLGLEGTKEWLRSEAEEFFTRLS